MKNLNRPRLLLASLLTVFALSFTPTRPPDVVGSWRMVAHRVSPAQDGITDLYTHFKELYGGCQKDMGIVLNADGNLKMTPAGGCQNPLGNVMMRAVVKFMLSGKMSWEAAGDKIILQDSKGQRKEYELQLNGSTMQWVFDETSKGTMVQHTIEYQRD